MGQTYNVTAKLKPINEKAAINTIQDFIEKNEGKKANFEVEEYRAKGISTDNFEGLIHILLSDQYYWHEDYDYEASFDGSYGWYGILIDVFEIIAPFLTEDSYMYIDGDECSCELSIDNGKMVFADTTPENYD